MDVRALNHIFEKHNIPDDAVLMSDSGWECDATNMNGVYYNEKKNIVVFTQYISTSDYYYKNPDWKVIHGKLYEESPYHDLLGTENNQN